MINIEQTNESSLQKKSPGILSALLTIVHVLIDLMMQSPKSFLKLRLCELVHVKCWKQCAET